MGACPRPACAAASTATWTTAICRHNANPQSPNFIALPCFVLIAVSPLTRISHELSATAPDPSARHAP